MTFVNDSHISDDNTGKFPEHEKVRRASNIALRLNNFFVWLVRQGVIQSKYFAYDAFPPSGETGDQIISRYLEISAEKLDAEKCAMAANFRKLAELAQNMDAGSVDAGSAAYPQNDQRPVSGESAPSFSPDADAKTKNIVFAIEDVMSLDDKHGSDGSEMSA